MGVTLVGAKFNCLSTDIDHIPPPVIVSALHSCKIFYTLQTDGDAESTVSEKNMILAQEQPRQDATALEYTASSHLTITIRSPLLSLCVLY